MLQPTPDLYQPRLSWWSHAWRLLLCLLISAAAWVDVVDDQWRVAPALVWLDLAGGVVGFVLMHFRRRWPFQVALLVTLLGLFSATSAGPSALVAVSLATRRNTAQILTIGVLGVVVSLGFDAYQPTQLAPHFLLSIGFLVAINVALLVTGMYIGSRRELLWTLRDRAERAESEQELRMAQARSNERARIAREMHDVLAHRISLVTMHSGALAYRTNLSQDEIAQTAQIIQSNAHQALVELRHVLGVLRSDDGEPAGDRPQPTFRDVAALIDEAVRSGMHLDYETSVSDAVAMPDQTGRTVYRIVQEGLTNARKHAPGARVSITVSGDQDHGVDVRVHNLLRPGANYATPGYDAPVSGLGLVGLAERAELTGGTLEHTHDRRSFTLHGWLPWAA